MKAKLSLLIILAFAVLVSGRSAKKKVDDKNAAKEEVKKEEKKEEEEVEEVETVEDEEDSVDVDSEEIEREDNKHMTLCLQKENVTETEMKNFLMSRGAKEGREPLKKVVLCFLKRINFFDGKNWNLKIIGESVGEDTSMFRAIKECLKKDDRKLQAHERTYRVQKCVLEIEDTE